MRPKTIQGVIRRRILVNFRVDPKIMSRRLPANFRPKIQNGFAVAGICLIRLEQMRPKHLPSFLGLRSENAAHRIAVIWDDAKGGAKEGVFVVRRDTNSSVNSLAGGFLFPGEYNPAHFEVTDAGEKIAFQMKSRDGKVTVRLRAKLANELPSESQFATLKAASDFFEAGSLGCSATTNKHRLEGMILKTKTWRVEPLEVEEVYSSYFSNQEHFPPGSVIFDCALLMRNLEHEWQSTPEFQF
jgi:hypothetical protein